MDERGSYRSLSLQRARQAVGETLRTCREGFGESLEQIALRTRVQERYLRALEEGDYSAFPGEIWARLFLRGYAQDLGLDAEALTEQAFGPTVPAPETDRKASTAPAGAVTAGEALAAPVASESDRRPQGRRARRRARRGAFGGLAVRVARGTQPSEEGPPAGSEPPLGTRHRARRRRARVRSGPGDQAVLAREAAPKSGGADTSAQPVHAEGTAVATNADEVLRVALGEDGADVAKARADEGEADEAEQAGVAQRGRWVTPGLAVGASLAVAALLTWLVVHLVTAPGNTGAVGTGPGGGARQVQHPSTVQAPAVTTVRDRAGQATYAVRASSVDLTLVFDGPCWVGLLAQSGNGYALSHTYEAGQMLHLARAPGFTLELGAAWRAHGVLNGTPIGPWRGGNVWYVSIVAHAAAHA